VIEAQDVDYPGFLRLIWNQHLREFSDLNREDRILCVDILVLLEEFILKTFKADKINIASLGNLVPHLHWHIIPRFSDDKHFPAPIWSEAKSHKLLSPRQQFIFDTQPDWIKRLRAELLRVIPN
jgi:diadenosine tetraphosphate (Ap4A) HIT family hydrolase